MIKSAKFLNSGSKSSQGQSAKAMASEKVNLMCAMFLNKVFGTYYIASSVVTGTSYNHLLTSQFLSILPTLPQTLFFRRTQPTTLYFGSDSVAKLETTRFRNRK